MSQLLLFMVCTMKKGTISPLSPQRIIVRYNVRVKKEKVPKMSMDAIIKMIDHFNSKKSQNGLFRTKMSSLSQKIFNRNHMYMVFSQKIEI